MSDAALRHCWVCKQFESSSTYQTETCSPSWDPSAACSQKRSAQSWTHSQPRQRHQTPLSGLHGHLRPSFGKAQGDFRLSAALIATGSAVDVCQQRWKLATLSQHGSTNDQCCTLWCTARSSSGSPAELPDTVCPGVEVLLRTLENCIHRIILPLSLVHPLPSSSLLYLSDLV